MIWTAAAVAAALALSNLKSRISNPESRIRKPVARHGSQIRAGTKRPSPCVPRLCQPCRTPSAHRRSPEHRLIHIACLCPAAPDHLSFQISNLMFRLPAPRQGCHERRVIHATDANTASPNRLKYQISNFKFRSPAPRQGCHESSQGWSAAEPLVPRLPRSKTRPARGGVTVLAATTVRWFSPRSFALPKLDPHPIT